MDTADQVFSLLQEFLTINHINIPVEQKDLNLLQNWRPTLALSNQVPLWSEETKGLCRLRVMLQDQEEPEFVLAFFTQRGTLHSTLYGNIPTEEAEFIPGVYHQRFPVICAPVPGEFFQGQPPKVLFYNEEGEHLIVSSILDVLGIIDGQEFHVIKNFEAERPQVLPHDRESTLRGLELCIGDSVSAEILLTVLLSKVHERSTLIGALCVNFTNVENSAQIINSLKSLTRTVVIQLTIDFLNNENLTPTKNEESEVLSKSVLQMPSQTLLIIDETHMNQGTLSAKGLENLNIFMQLIQTQTLLYDFGYSKMNFPTDLRIIVLSQGKSLLKVPITVSLLNNLTAYEFSARDRAYLEAAGEIVVKLPEEVVKIAQDYFVSRRKDKKITVEDLHLLLVFTRYNTQSFGLESAQQANWDNALSLFAKFTERIKN